MYSINDRKYLATCSKIARLLSVSLSSAKKKVEIQIAKKGSKTIEEKRKVAQDLLKKCEKDNANKFGSSKILDKLMSSLENEDNFMTEDWLINAQIYCETLIYLIQNELELF